MTLERSQDQYSSFKKSNSSRQVRVICGEEDKIYHPVFLLRRNPPLQRRGITRLFLGMGPSPISHICLADIMFAAAAEGRACLPFLAGTSGRTPVRGWEGEGKNPACVCHSGRQARALPRGDHNVSDLYMIRYDNIILPPLRWRIDFGKSHLMLANYVGVWSPAKGVGDTALGSVLSNLPVAP